jgi:hypothetical protein
MHLQVLVLVLQSTKQNLKMAVQVLLELLSEDGQLKSEENGNNHYYLSSIFCFLFSPFSFFSCLLFSL